MHRVGDRQRIHHLAPDDPYAIHLTLEAADDLDLAIAELITGGKPHLTRFLDSLHRAMERIATLPHLARFHHSNLRVTVLARHPYRIWYVIDEQTRTAILLGIIAVTHPTPQNGDPPGPWRKIWWRHLPYLPPRLPNPYPADAWAADPTWSEEEEPWWVPRMQPRPPA